MLLLLLFLYVDFSSNDIGHDCLYYQVQSNADYYFVESIDQVNLRNSLKTNKQLIPYCFRTTQITFNMSRIVERKITFFELSEKQVTSEDLYQWSIPIDTIEDYEYYQMNKDSIDGQNRFVYNCTYPYFGSICQY